MNYNPMLFPLSWIKEFVNIEIPFEDLAFKLSAAGLTVEKWEHKDNDIIFEPEITPNRPDWMRIVGIAREIAAVTDAKLKIAQPKLHFKTTTEIKEIKIKNNLTLCPRYSAIIINGVKVKSSPDWLQKRLKQIGLRPINNLVDITNYVMWELGNPLHVFDLDKIRGRQMVMEEAKGGEPFRSLDNIDYSLPKGAIIFKDLGRIIDLCGLKGGENTAVSNETKNILIHVPVYDPTHIRRTSQTLGLRSDASAIFERGANPGGTLAALERAVELTLSLGGGQAASAALDIKAQEFQPWTVKLRHQRLEKILGINISEKGVENIFSRLGLETKVSGKEYLVTVPTFRNDLHIEEDLIEEVGRIYGYNNFPKTLPEGSLPTTPVAYKMNYDLISAIKNILKGAGYTEIYTYSLISETQLVKLSLDPQKILRIDNPISRDYEYLRPHLLGNLLEAYKLNAANFDDIKLFELGKVYQGSSLDKIKEEYNLATIQTGEKFFEAKGEVELLLENLGVPYDIRPFENVQSKPWLHPGRAAQVFSGKEVIGNIGEIHPSLLTKFGIKSRATRWYLNYNELEKLANLNRKYIPISKYPSVVEDLSLIIPNKVLYSDIVETIKKSSHLIYSVELIDTHEQTQTFRIHFLDPKKNLTDKEAAEIRTKILKNLKEKLGVKLKE